MSISLFIVRFKWRDSDDFCDCFFGYKYFVLNSLIIIETLLNVPIEIKRFTFNTFRRHCKRQIIKRLKFPDGNFDKCEINGHFMTDKLERLCADQSTLV